MKFRAAGDHAQQCAAADAKTHAAELSRSAREAEVMAKQRIINRNYVCRHCGRMRRTPADYLPGAPRAHECCEQAMRSLSYETTIVASRMRVAERVEWLRSGGRFVKAGGGRRWKRAGRADT
jgi:hypothetical protein